MSDKRSENLIRQIEGRCHHFNGTQHDCCEAGINYLQLAGPIEGMGLRLPCHRPDLFAAGREKHGYKLADCPQVKRTTREEAEKEAAEMIEQSSRTMLAVVEAHKDAKSKGFGKGSYGESSLPCPLGCGGTLKYRVASYNGHMHAACSTTGCVSWME